MKTKFTILAVAAAVALPTFTYAEDPQAPGKSGTSTSNQTPKTEAPILAPTNPGEALEKDKDPGKQSTSTAPAPSKSHGDTVSGNPAPGKTAEKEAEKESKAEDSIAAEARAKEAQKSEEGREAGERAAGVPVQGNAGSVGGAKASR